jgi:hypothetical protein
MNGGKVEGLTSGGRVVNIDDPSAVEWRLHLGYLQSLTDKSKWENRYLPIATPMLAKDTLSLVGELEARGKRELRRDIRNLIGAAEDN